MSDPNSPPQPTSEMIPLGTDENLNASGGPEELSGATEAMQGLDLTAAPKSRFNMQMVILAIIVCVAGGVLYAMRRVGLAPAAGIAATPFKYDLPQSPKGAKNDQTSVLADLNASRTQQQVPTDQVKKNPFRMAGAVMMGGPAPEPGTVKPIDTTDAAARAAALEAAAHAKSLEQSFKALQLNGVMSGKPPVARINGKLYREGMVVNKQFTIASIDGLKVKLTADGREFDLTIANADGENTKP
ncbi:MAG: hypothetical protein ACREJO_14315 [Phycisphaerales bacterium]